jgi:hypothetical protein
LLTEDDSSLVVPSEKERNMKKLGISAVLMLFLAAAVWAAGSKPDSSVRVRNNSKMSVMVSAVWSGDNAPGVKVGAGESVNSALSVPASVNSVKLEVTGDECKKGEQTFNPQRVSEVMILCQNGTYTVALARSNKKP